MTPSMVSPSSRVEERLSVTTAIIGLLAVGGKIIDTLWDLNTPATKSSTIYAQALQEIKQCRSTVHVLYKTFSLLEAAQLSYPERGAWIKADHLIATLTDTVLAMSDLQAICDTLSLGKQGLATPPPEDPALDFESVSQHKKTIEGLCSRIRWHNLSMTMMMTILKCPGESDAQNSRVGLERRMTRLLSANTNLSGRMRRLDDVSDRNLRGRESLPHYSPPALHPNFWQLPSLAPYPGTPAAALLSAADTDTSGDNADGRPALSPLTGYTLADIPVLSIILLPVTTNELVDGNPFYTFAYARRVSLDLTELIQSQGGQGISRSLGVILGRTHAGADNGASSSSTGGSSSDSSPVIVETEPAPRPEDTHTKAKKWRLRSFKVRRRWRA